MTDLQSTPCPIVGCYVKSPHAHGTTSREADFVTLSALAKTDRAAFAEAMADICMGPEPPPHVYAGPSYATEVVLAAGKLSFVVILLWEIFQ